MAKLLLWHNIRWCRCLHLIRLNALHRKFRVLKHVHLWVEIAMLNPRLLLLVLVQVLLHLLLLQHGNDSLVVLDLPLIVLLGRLSESDMFDRSLLVSLRGVYYHALAVDVRSIVQLLLDFGKLLSPYTNSRLVIAVKA